MVPEPMEREKQPFSAMAVRATSATRSRIRSETALSAAEDVADPAVRQGEGRDAGEVGEHTRRLAGWL